jgi:transcriptional regulator with XRE-family HTH domain
MWLENLKELKKKTGLSTKQIAEKANMSERTVARIFSGETDHPYADTLDIITTAMGFRLSDIFGNTNVILASDDLVKAQEVVNTVEAERDLVAIENERLKNQVAALTTEVELLKKEVLHKEELLALHTFYGKMLQGKAL